MDLVMIDSDGVERRVEVERVDQRFVVTVDGERCEVDRVSAGPVQRSLIIDGAQWELSLQRRGRGRYLVSSADSESSFEALDPLDHLARSAAAEAGGQAASCVTAYMPGRVVTLLASEGDEVAVGQGIVVLEAMKMENEIETEVAGVVSRIFVEEGQSVEGGDDLFEIDPA